MSKNIKKLSLAGVLLAVLVVMTLLKNVSSIVSVPIINTVLVISCLKLGLPWAVVFSFLTPLVSLVFSTASAMAMLSFETNGAVLPIIIIGNILLVLCAYFAKGKGNKAIVISLVFGAILKWIFMVGGGEFIIKPFFTEKLGDKIALVNTIFSTLQLYSGLLCIVLVYPISKALDKLFE